MRLKNKRHFIHDGKEPFWEAFEEFPMATFDDDPTVHKLVINGDGAAWITACWEYFKDRAFFCPDRFPVDGEIRSLFPNHLAAGCFQYYGKMEIRNLFRNHPRYPPMIKAPGAFDGQKLLTELNSQVGTLGDKAREERLEALIRQLEQYPEALGDYRKWLEDQGMSSVSENVILTRQ